MKAWIKIQKIEQENRKEIIIGMCDEKILGMESGDFKISEHFFKGELIEIEEGLKKIKEATIVNLFGENVISEAIKSDYIEESSIKKINEIPHAQIILL